MLEAYFSIVLALKVSGLQSRLKSIEPFLKFFEDIRLSFSQGFEQGIIVKVDLIKS